MLVLYVSIKDFLTKLAALVLGVDIEYFSQCSFCPEFNSAKSFYLVPVIFLINKNFPFMERKKAIFGRV